MLGKLLDLVYPRTCEVCKRPVDRPGRYLCSDCLMRLPFIPRDGLCRQCGRDTVGLDGEYLCEDCATHHPHFDRASSVLRFELDARELVNSFKFREKTYLLADFADFLEGLARVHFQLNDLDAVVPMPATCFHRYLRGYNQCELLARALARRLGKPVRHLLRRVGNPARQGGLSEEDRRKNVVDTFAPEIRFFVPCRPPKTVLVVDDIMTTGSTLSEAAKTLKKMGVKRVWTITLARSVRY